MSVTLEALANITIRVLMVLTGIVLSWIARDMFDEGKKVKGTLLILMAAILILVKMTVDFD